MLKMSVDTSGWELNAVRFDAAKRDGGALELAGVCAPALIRSTLRAVAVIYRAKARGTFGAFGRSHG